VITSNIWSLDVTEVAFVISLEVGSAALSVSSLVSVDWSVSASVDKLFWSSSFSLLLQAVNVNAITNADRIIIILFILKFFSLWSF